MKHYKQKYQKLNINILHKLNERFAILHWPIEDDNLFDRYCEMLVSLLNNNKN